MKLFHMFALSITTWKNNDEVDMRQKTSDIRSHIFYLWLLVGGGTALSTFLLIKNNYNRLDILIRYQSVLVLTATSYGRLPY